MLQSTNCIRMGQILLDENLQLFILCNNCHIDIRNDFDCFRRHLENCMESNLFTAEGRQLKYNTDKSTQLFGKTAKGIKEFLIYDYTDVELEFLKTEEHFIDLINIEEELLDPKWYSDFNSEVNHTNVTSKQYDVLVEEVTPFVQFKENVKSNNRADDFVSSLHEVPTVCRSKLKKAASNGINDLMNNKVKTMKRNAPQEQTKDKISLSNSLVSKLENKMYVPFVKRRKIDNATTSNGTIISESKIITNPDSAINKSFAKSSHIPKQFDQPSKDKETATSQILNKLTNLGLQIKRTNQPAPPPPRNDDKTLETILLKLQSKGGMKVKLINKQNHPVNSSQQAQEPNFNNLIIRKVK